MKERRIEPGLLPTFRLYIAVRLLFVIIAGGFYVAWYRPPLGMGWVLGSVPYLVDILLLFVLLSAGRLQRWLGRLYLPIALLVAVAGPIVQVGYVLPRADADATFAFLLGLSLLLVPVILTAWQYSFGWVLLLGLATSLFEFLLLSSQTELTVAEARWSTVALVGRMLLTVFVGYVVSNLVDQQRRQRAELGEANRRLVQYTVTLEQLAVSRERNRLARELHDTLAHTLSALAVQLDAIDALWTPTPPEAQRMLDDALRVTRSGLDETRRTLGGLRATPLEDLGLPMAIRELAETVAARGGLRLETGLDAAVGPLEPEVEQCTYRVAQEALENVLRHANATRVSVSLRHEQGRLSLTVRDDGEGFAEEDGARAGRFGLQGMQERADLVGASLTVQSQPGEGTLVRLDYEEKRGNPRPDL
jgi:signal transduction histidine kinase